jgi:hypothetical protein
MSTQHLTDIAELVTAEWVADNLNDDELDAARSDAPNSGIVINRQGDKLGFGNHYEFETGVDAVLWIGGDGSMILWAGVDPEDPTVDGDWIYSDKIVA